MRAGIWRSCRRNNKPTSVASRLALTYRPVGDPFLILATPTPLRSGKSNSLGLPSRPPTAESLRAMAGYNGRSPGAQYQPTSSQGTEPRRSRRCPNARFRAYCHLFGACKCLMLPFKPPVLTLKSPVLRNNRKRLGCGSNQLRQ